MLLSVQCNTLHGTEYRMICGVCVYRCLSVCGLLVFITIFYFCCFQCVIMPLTGVIFFAFIFAILLQVLVTGNC